MKMSFLKFWIHVLLVKLLLYSNSDALYLISMNKPADMSSSFVALNHPPKPSTYGVDGNKQTYFETEAHANSWFLINLMNVYKISYITIYNRRDSYGERLGNVNISIGNSWRSFKPCGYFYGPGDTGGIYDIKCEGTGKFVFLQQIPRERFQLSEVEVYGTELDFPIESGDCLDTRFDEQNYYEGTLSTAANGASCINLSQIYSDLSRFNIFRGSFDTFKNFCRDPFKRGYQGCFISPSKWYACNLRRCTNSDERYSQLLSHKKPIEISSDDPEKSKMQGVEGIDNSWFANSSLTSAWWRVDLIDLCEIRFILMFNKFQNGERPNNITISTGMNATSLTQCAEFEGPGIIHKMYNITCKSNGKIVELKQDVYNYFSLTEVEVYGKILESSLISYKKPTAMSTKYGTHEASYGVDGDSNTFFHTQDWRHSWWLVDLIDFYEIEYILIVNRKDNFGERLRDLNVKVGGFVQTVHSCAYFHGPGETGATYNATLCKGRVGRIVRLEQDVANYFHLAEVEVYGDKLVDGNWADWTCPSVCESLKDGCNKTRTCTNPKPQHGGEDCPGKNISKEICPNVLYLISKNKPADMSSESGAYNIPPKLSAYGVDGNKHTYFETKAYGNSWFLINLINVYKISYVIMFNRHDSYGERLAKVNISIGNSWRSFKQCGYFPGPGETGGIYNITCVGTGKFVFLQQAGYQHFHLSEVEVYGTELDIPIESGNCLDTRFDEQNYYEGTLSTAADGSPCINLNQIHSDATALFSYDIFRGSFDTFKNFCRNPYKNVNQGCYTSRTEWKECNLRRCTNSDEIYSQLLSYMKPTEISSQIERDSKMKGVDGIHINMFTTLSSTSSWWRVDLIDLCEIRFILMFNKFNINGERLNDITISTGMNATSLTQCAEFEGPGITHKMYNITCKSNGKIVELKQGVYNFFSLSEVEVYGKQLESSLISYRKPTAMSSKYNADEASYGVDGDPNTIFHTQDLANSWWRVDLIDFYEIEYIVMVNRKDNSGWRLRRVLVWIGGFKDNLKYCAFFQGPGVTGATYNATRCKGRVGRIVQLEQLLAYYFHLAEVEVYGDKLVDGNWADWTCPTVCESLKDGCHKQRTCTNPKPQHGGEDCPGKNISKEICPTSRQDMLLNVKVTHIADF